MSTKNRTSEKENSNTVHPAEKPTLNDFFGVLAKDSVQKMEEAIKERRKRSRQKSQQSRTDT